MGLIRKFKQQTPARRRLWFSVVGTLLLVRVGLRLLPYQRVNDLVERRAAKSRVRSARSSAAIVTADDIVWAINSAAARLPGTTCLPRALAGRYLLLRAGLPGQVRFGVTKDGGVFAAHAWLESRDRILIGGETAADYLPLPAWPADAA
jgi:hypothetical protein